MILTMRLSFLSMIIVIIIISYDLEYFLKFGLLSSIIFYIWVYIVIPITYHTVEYFYTVCYYCKIRMKSINKNTEKLIKNTFIPYSSINELLRNYDNMFKTIINYNKMWKKIFFILVYSFIPFNLVLLHELLFEELPKQTMIAILFTIIYSLLILFSCNLTTASVLKQVLKSEKLIFKLLIKLGPVVNVKRK